MIPISQFRKPLEQELMNDISELDPLVAISEEELFYVRHSVFGVNMHPIRTKEKATSIAWHQNAIFYGCGNGSIYRQDKQEIVTSRPRPVLQLFTHDNTLYDLIPGTSVKSTLTRTLDEELTWFKVIEGQYCISARNIMFAYPPERTIDGIKQWVGELEKDEHLTIHTCPSVTNEDKAENFSIASDNNDIYWVIDDRAYKAADASNLKAVYALPGPSEKIHFSDTFIYGILKDKKGMFAINRETKRRRIITQIPIQDYAILPKEVKL